MIYLLDTTRYCIGSRVLFKKEIKKVYYLGFTSLIYIILYFGGLKYIAASWLYLVVYGCSFLSALLMIEGSVNDKILYILCLFGIFACFDELIGILIGNISNIKIGQKSIIESCISIIFLLILFGVRKTVWKFHINAIWVTAFGVLSSICLAFMVSFLPDIEYLNGVTEKWFFKWGILIIYCCAIGGIVATVYIKEINQKKEQLIKTEQVINEMQKKYYLTLLEKEEETRKYRHDMNNHLLCLREMSDKDSKIQRYIDELQKQMDNIGGKSYETGSEILNIILTTQLPLNENIKVLTLGKIKADPDISDVDFCIIISNLLKNAIEEVTRNNYSDEYIKIILKTGNTYLIIEIKNPSTALIKTETGKIVTHKYDKKNHGFGLQNVSEAVERNGGTFSIESDGVEVTAKVILKLKCNSKN